MRVAPALLVAMMTGAYASPIGDPPSAPTVRDSSRAGEPPVETALAVNVTSVEPVGARVALDEPIEVELDAPANRLSVQASTVIEPAVEGRFVWRSDRAFAWQPDAWREGRRYAVHVAGEALDGRPIAPVEWHFRTRIEKPGAITPGEGKPIVLTFDDAPGTPSRARRLLDVLAKHDAKVIFFPANVWAERAPKWLARARAEGHLVCNHTLNHRDLSKPWLTEDDIRREIERGAGHGECDLFRPPMMAYDSRVEAIAKKLGYRIYLWDIDTYDWAGVPKDDIVNKVLRDARPGAVVLFHMHPTATLEALPELLGHLRDAGYALTHENATERLPGISPPG